MDTRKPTPKKKTAPKKEKRDFSQVALSIVEQVTGEPLAAKKPRR
jgi:hypothetical protein